MAARGRKKKKKERDRATAKRRERWVRRGHLLKIASNRSQIDENNTCEMKIMEKYFLVSDD